MFDQSILGAEIRLEAAEDADVVPFGEPGVVVFGGCGAEIAIAARAGGLSCVWAHGGFGWFCGREEKKRVKRKLSLTRGLLDRSRTSRLRSSVDHLRSGNSECHRH